MDKKPKYPWEKGEKMGPRISPDIFENGLSMFFGFIVLMVVLMFLIEGIAWIIGLFE